MIGRYCLKKADRVREYVLTHRIIPEALAGERRVEVVAREVARFLHLDDRYPLVVNALTNSVTRSYINQGLRELGLCLRDIKKEGLKEGPNTRVIYELGPCEEVSVSKGSGAGGRPSEEWIRGLISSYLGLELRPGAVLINGKAKRFDLLNEVEHVVGDIKVFTFKGPVPAAEHDNLFVYICLMEKLERYTGTKWRKLIVGAGRRKIFEDFVRRYRSWLPEDLEVYFIDASGNVERLM